MFHLLYLYLIQTIRFSSNQLKNCYSIRIKRGINSAHFVIDMSTFYNGPLSLFDDCPLNISLKHTFYLLDTGSLI
ncbi:hypothetical protein A0J61_01915 [Choanephora cucurbitarum]|uniref:Uncharacterized protein n=1 Tax=Choanephora cucurbitarum TaxID=101091 RepID=A0A1C7NLI9_9FUNG|nr:hypothetical protein A0J61_01915 [Choanephora cucurbitarum]